MSQAKVTLVSRFKYLGKALGVFFETLLGLGASVGGTTGGGMSLGIWDGVLGTPSSEIILISALGAGLPTRDREGRSESPSAIALEEERNGSPLKTVLKDVSPRDIA